jgi:hypothetical protein
MYIVHCTLYIVRFFLKNIFSLEMPYPRLTSGEIDRIDMGVIAIKHIFILCHRSPIPPLMLIYSYI